MLRQISRPLKLLGRYLFLRRTSSKFGPTGNMPGGDSGSFDEKTMKEMSEFLKQQFGTGKEKSNQSNEKNKFSGGGMGFDEKQQEEMFKRGTDFFSDLASRRYPYETPTQSDIDEISDLCKNLAAAGEHRIIKMSELELIYAFVKKFGFDSLDDETQNAINRLLELAEKYKIPHQQVFSGQCTAEDTKKFNLHFRDQAYHIIPKTGWYMSQCIFGSGESLIPASQFQTRIPGNIRAGINTIQLEINEDFYEKYESEYTYLHMGLNNLFTFDAVNRENLIYMCRYYTYDTSEYSLISPERFKEHINKSLTCFNTTTIDVGILQLNRTMGPEDIEIYLKILKDEVYTGRISKIGLSGKYMCLSNQNYYNNSFLDVYKLIQKYKLEDHFILVEAPFNLLQRNVVFDEHNIDNRQINFLDFLKSQSISFITSAPFESGIYSRPLLFTSMRKVFIEDVKEVLLQLSNTMAFFEIEELPKIISLSGIKFTQEERSYLYIGPYLGAALENIRSLLEYIKVIEGIYPDYAKVMNKLKSSDIPSVKKYCNTHNELSVLSVKAIKELYIYNDSLFMDKISEHLNKLDHRLTLRQDLWSKTADLYRALGIDGYVTDLAHITKNPQKGPPFVSKESAYRIISTFKLPHENSYLDKPVSESERRKAENQFHNFSNTINYVMKRFQDMTKSNPPGRHPNELITITNNILDDYESLNIKPIYDEQGNEIFGSTTGTIDPSTNSSQQSSSQLQVRKQHKHLFHCLNYTDRTKYEPELLNL